MIAGFIRRTIAEIRLQVASAIVIMMSLCHARILAKFRHAKMATEVSEI